MSVSAQYLFKQALPLFKTKRIMDVRTQTKYDDLVDIRLPILSLTKFIHARDVQLNEHCV